MRSSRRTAHGAERIGRASRRASARGYPQSVPRREPASRVPHLPPRPRCSTAGRPRRGLRWAPWAGPQAPAQSSPSWAASTPAHPHSHARRAHPVPARALPRPQAFQGRGEPAPPLSWGHLAPGDGWAAPSDHSEGRQTAAPCPIRLVWGRPTRCVVRTPNTRRRTGPVPPVARLSFGRGLASRAELSRSSIGGDVGRGQRAGSGEASGAVHQSLRCGPAPPSRHGPQSGRRRP